MKNKVKKFIDSTKKYVPAATWIFVAVAALSFVALVIMKKSVAVADALNATTGRAIRFVLTNIFNIFPFSFTETLVLLSPVLLALVIILCVRAGKRGIDKLTRTVCVFLCVTIAVFSSFVFGYEASYYGSGIEKNVGFERRDVSVDELKQTALILLDRVKAELDEIGYLESGSSVMPYRFSEMSDKLNDAYEKFCEKYPAYQSMYSRLKPVILSEPWTYTHISGLYSFFTGEANINVNYPDFIVVSTAAHEMSHQRGMGKEDECDFASFLVCTMSDDPYIRYSGYLENYLLVVDKLYGADKGAWFEVRSQEDGRIAKELSAFSKFFDKYRENVAAKVNDAVNNAYIQSHNQPAGVKSYGLVVDLIVNYIINGD
ncbi:MAG: DUF3810 domain-containing protein [Clostridia bacterium]|nr:DUF3810 domain-containing protein [Clostridia bacterium]